MNFRMLVGLSLFVGFAAIANAQAPNAQAEGQARTIQAYAMGCDLYLFDGMPVLKVNLYETQAQARASKTSPQAPHSDVVLDFGPGIAIGKANPQSQLRLICAAIMAQNAEKPIIVRTNAQNIVESVLAYGQDLKSDSFALMPPNAQKAILELLKALSEKEAPQEKDQEKDQERPPERAPLSA